MAGKHQCAANQKSTWVRRCKVKSSTLNKWHFYSRFLKGFERPLLVSTVGAVCAASLLLVIPLLVRYVFNEVIPQEKFGVLALIAFLALIIHGAYLAISLWVRQNVFTISKEVTKTMRREAVKELYTWSDSVYSHMNRADLHARFIIDFDRVDKMTEALIGGLLPTLLIGVLLISGMLFVSWQLLLVALVVFSSLIPITRWTGNRFRILAQQHQSIVRSYSSRLEFSISHFLLTKLKSAENQELEIHDKMIEQVANSGRTLAIWRGLFSELQNFFAFATAVVLLGMGVAAAYAGWLTMGDVLAFYVLAMLFRGQYALFSQALTPALEGAQALTTIQEVLTIQDEPTYQGKKRIEYQGGIKLQDVDFSYGQNNLLKGVNFELKPGDIAGIMGSNGSGKTTIAKLALGLYRPISGKVLADGECLSNLDLNLLRRQIGVVMQETMLFGGSIAENISYGDPLPNERKIRMASQIATLNDFVENLPEGYATNIGDQGIMLSGGQQQKISIARAIYDQPRLLILDEPTNHLDSESIDKILRNLTKLAQKPSVMIISHDVRALKQVDFLYQLENGSLNLLTLRNSKESNMNTQ